MVYKAYNKIYFKGKAVGKPFVHSISKSRMGAKKETLSSNRRWNKLKTNSHYKVKLFKIVKR